MGYVCESSLERGNVAAVTINKEEEMGKPSPG